eukprot:TRINITY_DN539_c0_g1_i3.p3 TRINITY_DN539_c0_g1~~TRINITY_DN539_c0_g1_i3.p3  ORF type:complete len:228 (+),score=42.46 TRINITY_DN539_c0_g1_i3:252-935(+)
MHPPQAMRTPVVGRARVPAVVRHEKKTVWPASPRHAQPRAAVPRRPGQYICTPTAAAPCACLVEDPRCVAGGPPGCLRAPPCGRAALPTPRGPLACHPPTAPVHRRWGATGGGHARPAYATSPLSHMPPPTTTAGTAAVATPPVAAAHKPTAAAVEATPPTTGEAAAAPAAAVAKPPAAATPQTSAVAVAADAAAPAMRGSGPGSVDVAAVVEAGTDDASSSRWTTE